MKSADKPACECVLLSIWVGDIRVWSSLLFGGRSTIAIEVLLVVFSCSSPFGMAGILAPIIHMSFPSCSDEMITFNKVCVERVL